MSLIEQVTAIVREKHRASLDDICVEGKSREQVQKAMQNAVQRGLIRPVQHRQRGLHQGRLGSVYEATAAQPVKKPKVRRERRTTAQAVSSIWRYAQL